MMAMAVGVADIGVPDTLLEGTESLLSQELLALNLVVQVTGHIRHEPGDESLDTKDKVLKDDDESQAGSEHVPEEACELVGAAGRIGVVTQLAEASERAPVEQLASLRGIEAIETSVTECLKGSRARSDKHRHLTHLLTLMQILSQIGRRCSLLT